MPNGMLMRLDLRERAFGPEHLDDPVARLEAVEALQRLRHAAIRVALFTHRAIGVDHNGSEE